MPKFSSMLHDQISNYSLRLIKRRFSSPDDSPVYRDSPLLVFFWANFKDQFHERLREISERCCDVSTLQEIVCCMVFVRLSDKFFWIYKMTPSKN